MRVCTLVLLGCFVSRSAMAEETEPAARASIQTLTEQLSAAEARGAASAEEAAYLKALLQHGSVLVDIHQTVEDRMAAARTLTELAEPSTFPFLHAASRSERPQLRRVVIDLAPRWKSADAVALLAERIRREFGEGGALRRQKAFHGLGLIQSEDAAVALWDLSIDNQVLRPVRDQARSVLMEQYRSFVDARGGLPSEKNDPVGVGTALVGSAITGGVLLSSVGTWGQSEAGASVGAIGGAAIGAGTASLYLRSNTVTRGAGERYASNVLWGVTAAGLTNAAFDIGDRDMEAVVRTLGVTAGAVTGYGRMKHQPTEATVFETNFGGVLGLHLGSSLPGVYKPVPTKETEFEHLRQLRNGGALIGGAVGLGVSSLVTDAWEPDWEDGLYSGLMAVEGSILGSTIPDRHGLRNRNSGAYGNVGFNLGLTSGLVLTHFVQIPVVTTQVAAAGATIGHVSGDAVAKFNAKRYNNTAIGAQIAVPAGLAGTVIGTLAAPKLAPTTADAAAIGVGTALTSIQAGAISFYLYENKVLKGYQPEAITQLTGSATAATLLALSPKMEVAPAQSLFLLSGASWGAWYGALGQMVVPNNMTDPETVLLVTTMLDLGVGTTAVLSSDKVGIKPEDTFIPQLFGVAGGTVGALAVMLATESSRKIAGGALVGSTVGLGAGAIFGSKMKKSARTDSVNRPSLGQSSKKKGHWTFIAVPDFGAEGEWGGQFKLQGVGL